MSQAFHYVKCERRGCEKPAARRALVNCRMTRSNQCSGAQIEECCLIMERGSHSVIMFQTYQDGCRRLNRRRQRPDLQHRAAWHAGAPNFVPGGRLIQQLAQQSPTCGCRRRWSGDWAFIGHARVPRRNRSSSSASVALVRSRGRFFSIRLRIAWGNSSSIWWLISLGAANQQPSKPVR